MRVVLNIFRFERLVNKLFDTNSLKIPCLMYSCQTQVTDPILRKSLLPKISIQSGGYQLIQYNRGFFHKMDHYDLHNYVDNPMTIVSIFEIQYQIYVNTKHIILYFLFL